MNMKKIFCIAVVLLGVASLLGAQTKAELKSVKSEAAAAAKTIKKEKFKMVELGDLQKRLEQYFTKINSGCTQVVGIAENCTTSNLAKLTAMNNAVVEYASNSGGIVRGRVASDASTMTADQIDALVAAYERIICKELKGELVPYITLLRDRSNSIDSRVYCLVDVESAHAAKIRAMEIALEESRLAEQYGSQISNWIDEGFDKLKTK